MFHLFFFTTNRSENNQICLWTKVFSSKWFLGTICKSVAEVQSLMYRAFFFIIGFLLSNNTMNFPLLGSHNQERVHLETSTQKGLLCEKN